MFGKNERYNFIEKLKADVQEYKNLCNADAKTISEFDCKKIQGDWKAVVNDIRLSINKLEEIEQNER